ASNSPQISGFRIQITFDPERKTIDEARERFTSVYPTIDTYVIFNAPNYVLKVGDFRSQLEAEKIKNSFVSDFPTCFIIKEMINLPRIDQD
ncbi:MAG: SPOR domain-containing protein, partial [Flavobacteriia bacterium]